MRPNCVKSANPRAFAVIVYWPGGKPPISYVPFTLVFAENVCPVGLTADICAFVTTAPDGSVTCPRKVPVGVCADAGTEIAITIANTTNNR